MSVTYVAALPDTEVEFEPMDLPLAMGNGFVDPELVRPHEHTAEVDELIAFRCSSL